MSLMLAEMTWPEVERAIAAGMTTVILPMGATEQHGPHLPLGTDTFRAASLTEGLSGALPEALVAPVLPVGCSDEHTGFPGLLSLDHETLARLIVDCGRRIAAWGVRRLVLLSAHGGNGEALELARTRLQEQASGLEIRILTSSTALSEAFAAVAAAAGISPDDVGLHAGEGETSEMLHLRPELVRMDRAAAGYAGSMSEVMPRLRAVGLRGVTPTGTLGDPRAACASRGAKYLAAEIDGYRRTLATEADPRFEVVAR
ncbi:MAG: mycofactocin biosynthesis peptidyl-dipeptidase MftE [Rhodospirillales bacterium]|nr:mycofactocin biosynthesis peptidyl-dipeptidase MftE [Rhodospirillales bacterium]